VHLPPQLLVALEAGGEAGLGEAVGHSRQGRELRAKGVGGETALDAFS
jgi:hypothetical protein